jgi:hypothetical protein
LIDGQQLQQVSAGAPPPKPDDPGYFTVTTSPMPGWPDKIDPKAPGYNWFFWLVDVKLPKKFRFLNVKTPVPAFTVTLRDISSDSGHQAPDLNLPVLAWPPPPFGPNQPTPPSEVFLSGENSKNEPWRRRATLGIVAGAVTLAGWLVEDAVKSRSNDNQVAGSGRSEDWHFSLWLDPDFIQRNYDATSEPLASASIPGQPESAVCINCCHVIPLTGRQKPDVGTFLMPGTGLMTVELNAWHTDAPAVVPNEPAGRGPNAPAGWVHDPNKDVGDTNFPDDSGICVSGTNPCKAAVYPNNMWAFNVLTGTALPGYPLPPNDEFHQGQLRAGDYVIVTGTLWEDIAHIKSDPVPMNACFEHVLSCQGG